MIRERILVVADDLAMFRSIQTYMESDFTEVCHAVSAQDILDALAVFNFCLIIVDFCPPKMDEVDILSAIRRVRSTPVLVLTEIISESTKVSLFRAGANAVVEKPVDMSVCAAQARSLIQLYINSSEEQAGHPLIFGTELMIDPTYRQVIIDGNQLVLTRKEFDLLLCIARHPGRVWSRTQLYNQVWSDNLGLSGENAVKVHIGNLRKKLANMGKNYIQTSWGVGYKFVPPYNSDKIGL